MLFQETSWHLLEEELTTISGFGIFSGQFLEMPLFNAWQFLFGRDIFTNTLPKKPSIKTTLGVILFFVDFTLKIWLAQDLLPADGPTSKNTLTLILLSVTYRLKWLGNFFHNILFGILVVQVYIYYVAFPKDHWAMKSLVYLVFALEIVQTVIRAVDRFEVDVMRYADTSVLDEQLLDWFSTPLLTAVTSAIVQAFFGYRVHVFSKSWIIPFIVWVPTLLQLGSGIALGAVSEPVPLHEMATNPRITRVVITWVTSTVVTDVFIAVLLTYYLYTMKSGISQTDTLISRIIRLTVETGTVTAIWAIMILVLFYEKPPWFLIFSDTIGKLYANNLMVMFNRRVDLTGQGGTTVHSMGTGTNKAPNTTTGAESRIEFSGNTSGDRTLGSFNTKPDETGSWELSQRGKESFV
ncbi:hypothetical protein DL96DRAFT_1557179 [Flagelloscypha sp. PMI_526]|nr:hypothetical protein DL96DRAFT_1557179 [Flagelloscypha sp. PMI_526]